MTASPDSTSVTALARQVASAGAQVGLPYVAASPDIGSPTPLRGDDGRPLAETVFRWLDPALKYWEDRGFALRSAFVHAARSCAEPFYFLDGRLATWRENAALAAINSAEPFDRMGVESAIVAPTYLPGGVIGAVVWASPEHRPDLAEGFMAHAAELHALALRLVATHAEPSTAVASPARLTRREIQCVKWAAAGKTDQEIGQIIRLAAPTVRFHLKNASRKLEARGRSQTIHRAAALGYIGQRWPLTGAGARPAVSSST
ncbi:MAG TPA: helix-turn-helix transcriptional regulator [Phenylobacterium sp.]|jgi:DNA-binding CsgD family transcriptional regulator